MSARTRAAAALLIVFGLPLAAQQRAPQQEISESRRRLQEIRQERQELRGQLSRIRGQVHDVSGELQIIRRQATLSASLVRELNLQLAETQKKIEATTQELTASEVRLAEKKALLNRRLRDLYKRGPLHAAEVLLSSRTFADLLNRYKYLHLVAQRDRGLVDEVEELSRQLALREQELRRSYNDIQYLQNERADEHSQLQSLQGQRGETLSVLQKHERSTAAQLAELARDERRLTGLVATLEARRREAERRERERVAAAARNRPANAPAAPAAPARVPASTLTTADVGNLGWPVGGRLVYRFGRVTQPNGTAVRYNGVGIGAAAGSPVRAVEAGTVEMAAPFEGYGPTVVVSHGGGYYSLYLYLAEVQVKQGTTIARGQVIGTVGGQNTPEGAHIEFQIRAPGGQAVDPLTWLRGQAR
ncbi:MAG TPA: peptidoglycan DD-metalloendopeptidase family protein [Longimicrobium sp.]